MTLEEFLNQPYQLIASEYHDPEYDERGVTIDCPQLGIQVFGETLKEAIGELQEAKIAWWEMKTELGKEIPYPKKML